MKEINVAILASGNGTNALKLIDHFNHHSKINIAFIFSNNPNALVIDKAINRNVKVLTCNNNILEETNFLIDNLSLYSIDYILLAGFLRKIPKIIIEKYPQRILNIHPSLLPKFGGAGMYGMHVHKAVKEAKENISGITIHYVTEEFDKGQPIAQFYTSIEASDTAYDIQQKIQKLEHTYFPFVSEQIMLSQQK